MKPSEALVTIAEAAAFAGLPQIAQGAKSLGQRLAFDSVHVVVIGEFNRGKTTLVNALIGRSLLPMDIVPTTAAIWVIQRGETTAAAITRMDGSSTPLPPTPDGLARLNADGDLSKDGVKFVRVSVEGLAIGSDVILVDTPGVNDINQSRADITYGFLGQADAAIFVMDASSPMTRSEADFLRGQVLDAHLSHLTFILNKTSRLDDDEVSDAVAAAAARLKETLGRDVCVVGADAARILDALEAGHPEAADRWGWAGVRAAIDDLLLGARDRVAREEAATLRVRALARCARVAIEGEIERSRLSAEQMAEAQARFEREVRELRPRLERLLEYGDVHGRDQLKLMIAQSLRERTDEFVQEQQARLSGMRGDFEPYAKQMLPTALQQLVKRWFDSRQPVIERYLADFCSKVVAEYTRHFDAVLSDLPSLRLSGPSRGDVSFQPLDVRDANEYFAYALPAAGGLAAGFLIAGPFALVGAAAGALAAKFARDRDVKATREMLSASLPDIVEQAVTSTRVNLDAQVDQWFASLQEGLRGQFERDDARRRHEFDRALASDPATQVARQRLAQEWIVRLAPLSQE